MLSKFEKQLWAVFLFICIALPGGTLHAASPISRFVFITEPQTVQPGVLSEALTIQAQNEAGALQQSDETIDLSFASTSASGEFLSAAGEPVKTVMNKGTANRTFYYRDAAPGTHTLTVQAVGRVSGQSWIARQDIIIGSGPASAAAAQASAVPPPPSAAASGGAAAVSGASVAPPPPAGIRAYAGGGRKVLAGQAVEFQGEAIGLEGAPIDNARFLWNYGDGSVGEGRAATHIFRIPGTYIVGLHVSSGIYAASDYAAVTAAPNQLAISEVVGGKEGYIRIRNQAVEAADIGGWAMEDSRGKNFLFPPRTVIGAKSEAAFPNAVTGLMPEGALRLQYPDGSPALERHPAEAVPVVLHANQEKPAAAHPLEFPREHAAAADRTEGAENPQEPLGLEDKIQARTLAATATDALLAAGAGTALPGTVFFLLAGLMSIAAAAGFLAVRKFFM